jgi:hypothetical protein
MQVIPLKYGTIFKQAFGQPEVFRQFAKDILGIDINIDKVQSLSSPVRPAIAV